MDLWTKRASIVPQSISLMKIKAESCRGGKIRPPHDYQNYPEFLKKLLSDQSDSYREKLLDLLEAVDPKIGHSVSRN